MSAMNRQMIEALYQSDIRRAQDALAKAYNTAETIRLIRLDEIAATPKEPDA